MWNTTRDCWISQRPPHHGPRKKSVCVNCCGKKQRNNPGLTLSRENNTRMAAQMLHPRMSQVTRSVIPHSFTECQLLVGTLYLHHLEKLRMLDFFSVFPLLEHEQEIYFSNNTTSSVFDSDRCSCSLPRVHTIPLHRYSAKLSNNSRPLFSAAWWLLSLLDPCIHITPDCNYYPSPPALVTHRPSCCL